MSRKYRLTIFEVHVHRSNMEPNRLLDLKRPHQKPFVRQIVKEITSHLKWLSKMISRSVSNLGAGSQYSPGDSECQIETKRKVRNNFSRFNPSEREIYER